MRRTTCLLAVVLLFAAGGTQAQAQIGLGNVFSGYYGFYLPQQMQMMNRPVELETLNADAAMRQMTAQTGRSSLTDPASAYGDDEFDPLASGSRGRGAARLGRMRTRGMYTANSLAARPMPVHRRIGPGEYYDPSMNMTLAYYPQLRIGRGASLGASGGAGSSRRRGGGMGMPGIGGVGMGGGMGMPR